MTDYGRITSRVQFGQNSDLSYPELDSKIIALNNSATKFYHQQMPIGQTARSITTSLFTTVEGALIKNSSSTTGEIITVTYYTEFGTKTFAGGADDCSLTSDAANDYITDNGASGVFLTGYSANLASHVTIAGSLTAGNNVSWQIKSASANSVVLCSNSGYTTKITTDAANDSITLHFFKTNTQILYPGSYICIADPNFYANLNMSLIARSGTPEVDLYILAT